MRFVRPFFAWFLILTFVALISFGVYLQMNGERLAEEHLSRIFKRPVQVGKAYVQFPLGLTLSDFEVQGIVQSRAVEVQFRLPLVVDRQLLVSKFILVNPLIFVARDKEARITLLTPEGAAAPVPAPSTAPAPPAPTAKKPPALQGVFVDYFEIQDGKIQYADESLEKNYQVRLEDLDLKASEVSYPFKPVRSRSRFSVVIFGEEIAFSGSKVQGEGWVNLADKDMNAKVEALEPKGDKWLMVNLVSEKNDMTVEGKIDINQIARTNQDSQDISLQDYVFGALQSSGLQVGLGFMFKTKMDAFKVDNVSLFGDVKYQESEGSKNFLEENLKKIGEQLESLGSGGEANLNAVAPSPAEGNQTSP